MGSVVRVSHLQGPLRTLPNNEPSRGGYLNGVRASGSDRTCGGFSKWFLPLCVRQNLDAAGARIPCLLHFRHKARNVKTTFSTKKAVVHRVAPQITPRHFFRRIVNLDRNYVLWGEAADFREIDTAAHHKPNIQVQSPICRPGGFPPVLSAPASFCQTFRRGGTKRIGVKSRTRVIRSPLLAASYENRTGGMSHHPFCGAAKQEAGKCCSCRTPDNYQVWSNYCCLV